MTSMLTTLRIELESTRESVATIRAMIVQLAVGCRLQIGLTEDLMTAVSEACNNVVLHAYPGGRGPLVVLINVAAVSVDAEVKDFGCGTRAPVSPGDGLGLDGNGLGLGIGVIRAASSRARFATSPNGGTTVTMSFDRPAGPRQDARAGGVYVVKPGAATRHHQRRPSGYGCHVSRGSHPGSP